MLLSLNVRDFAIVHEIQLDFEAGMTVLTGETGAGKSILVDALSLVLGERGSAKLVREGAKRAEFSAEFDLSRHAAATDWLAEHELDEEGPCLLRRVVSAEGRSRAFINGNAVTMQQLKSLGDMLVDIHGQHFHQSLGRKPVQRQLLDHFGGHGSLSADVAAAFGRWQSLRDELDELRVRENDRASRLEFVEFQLDELEKLALDDGELDELNAERQRLLHSGKLAEGMNRAMAVLSDGDVTASSLLADARRELESLADIDAGLKEAVELLQGAEIQVGEAADTVLRHVDDIEADPERHRYVEERLDSISALARKHRIEPDALPERQKELENELHTLKNAGRISAQLEQDAEAAEQAFRKLAKTLSSKRKAAAKRFATAVTDAMSGLGMPGGRFEVRIEPLQQPRANGQDDIVFLISANPGQSPMPLSEVASGGELARMSLAIQVIASDGSDIPTMVFDEVDSGVGGGVAEMVGRRLAELGHSRQVLCVTHLPQVASLADHHLRVSKVSDGKATRTGISPLSTKERVEELARMLGGVDITKKTLEHAAEMLNAARKRA